MHARRLFRWHERKTAGVPNQRRVVKQLHARRISCLGGPGGGVVVDGGWWWQLRSKASTRLRVVAAYSAGPLNARHATRAAQLPGASVCPMVVEAAPAGAPLQDRRGRPGPRSRPRGLGRVVEHGAHLMPRGPAGACEVSLVVVVEVK